MIANAVIAIVAVLGPGLFNLYVAVSAVGWVPYARLVRSEMVIQSQRDYAAAARVMGFGPARIVFGHLLPNAITPTPTAPAITNAREGSHRPATSRKPSTLAGLAMPEMTSPRPNTIPASSAVRISTPAPIKSPTGGAARTRWRSPRP